MIREEDWEAYESVARMYTEENARCLWWPKEAAVVAEVKEAGKGKTVVGKTPTPAQVAPAPSASL